MNRVTTAWPVSRVSQPGDLRSTGHQLISVPSWATSPVRTQLTAHLAVLSGLSFQSFYTSSPVCHSDYQSFFLVRRLIFGELILIHEGDVWIWESNWFSDSVWALWLIFVSRSPAVARVLVDLMINHSVSQFGQYLRVTRCQDFWHLVLMSEIVFLPTQLPYSSLFYPLQVPFLPFLLLIFVFSLPFIYAYEVKHLIKTVLSLLGYNKLSHYTQC